MTVEREDRINSFLRSVFRFKQMTKKNAPDELISMEKAIMADRLEALSAEDVYIAITFWPEYQEKQLVLDEIENEKVARDLDAHIMSLN